ncbi:MAG: hypothetical protein ACJAZS_000408 [Alteromonas naphthalenivorans]|jgi:hypothetical protein
MKISRLPHYMKRLTELGPLKAAEVISHRMHISFFEQYARYQADQKRSAITWPLFAQKYKLGDFPTFFNQLKKRSFIASKDLYATELKDEKELMRQAAAFSHNCFDILGSREQCLITLPWHSDFRLQYQHPDADYLFDKNKFYKDIAIQSGLTDRLVKDIKVPWELSRLQHLFVMGAAFERGKDPMYARAFEQHVADFLDENPFLLGPNWMCPMDVGIRTLNLVWAFHFFKDSEDISDIFWKRFVCSLYDHMHYLENNWEIYSVTSNHYLSDLIGYFYVTWLFHDMPGVAKKHKWCYNEILKEFDKQVFEEGTDYEGSTNYHKLVTEIFYNFYLICQESNLPLPKRFLKKLKKMFSFIDWCAVNDTDLVKIGDDDSGKILHYGIPRTLVNEMQEECALTEKFYKNFGLAVRKTKEWHITLRHHAYKSLQPSGHFHNDIGSVTLAVDGIAVVVDPGSYVYTPSEVWRNKFRSASAHNGFFIEDIEPILFDEQLLFNLALPEKKSSDTPWQVTHDLYSIPATRVLELDQKKNHVLLTDSWDEVPVQAFTSVWNFTLAPGIEATKKGDDWSLSKDGKVLLVLHTEDLDFCLEKSWYSPSYGTKVACKKLVAKSALSTQPVRIFFKKV